MIVALNSYRPVPRIVAACRLCKRDCAPSSPLCEYHLRARRNLDSAYKEWSEAYGGMTWAEYLRRIIKSDETGQWAKEVAEMLSKETSG
jgi:hypothetical protein